MENIDFVLWAIGWPLMIKLDSYLTTLINEIKKSPQEVNGTGDESVIVIWIIVGLFLIIN